MIVTRTCIMYDADNSEILVIRVEDPQSGYHTDDQIAQLIAKELTHCDSREEYENISLNDLNIKSHLEVNGNISRIISENDVTIYAFSRTNFENFENWLDEKYPPEEEKEESEESEEGDGE